MPYFVVNGNVVWLSGQTGEAGGFPFATAEQVQEHLVQAAENIGIPAGLPPIKKSRKLVEGEEMIVQPMEGFKFGADPELFVFDDNDRPVPAAGLIPGSKESPFVVDYGAVQVDGMAAEFNIDPATTFAEFNRNIEKVMKQLEGYLPTGYSLRALPAVRFDAAMFDAAPDEAKELGCSPDWNAWTKEINPPPAAPDDPYMRCAAGHIHFGWTEDAGLDDPQHIMNCFDLVKQLDWYLGYWSTKMDPDPTRRKLYGKAGACRLKSYGVEYRVLSNFWITTRDRRLAVWNRMQQAIHDMRTRFMPEYCKGGFNDLLQEAVTTTSKNPTLESYYRYPLITVG